MKKVIIILVTILLSAGFAFAGGNMEEPPEVLLNFENDTAISPNASFGEQDELDFIFSVAPAKGKTIVTAEVAVIDPEGSVVWTYEIVPPKEKGEPFSESVSWDGTRIGGAYLNDGRYLIQAVAWDSNEIYGESELKAVTIDNTVPSVSIELPYSVFSPNSDGRKDFLVIEQDGSTEKVWNAEIVDSEGNSVLTKQWIGRSPDNFTWDGRDKQGNVVPDGTYGYSIESIDEAGNSVKSIPRDITVSTVSTSIELTRNMQTFSPNNDGVKDSILFTPAVDITEGIREWTASVMNEAGSAVWTLTGSDIPETIEYTGQRNGGGTASDGEYTAMLSVLYRNGNKPEAVTKSFIIDTQRPQAELAVNYDVFSPDGDKDRDTLIVSQETSRENKWEGMIVDANGNTVAEYSWRGTPADELSWGGRDDSGTLVADGQYKYVLTATDEAGNSAEYETAFFEKKRFDITDIGITKTADYFSPNGDGVKDSIDFSIKITGEEELESFTFSISDSDGSTVYEMKGSTVQERTVTWDGNTESGSKAADGTYTAALQAVYTSGDEPSLTTDPFYLDTTQPSAAIEPEYTLFSPNDDGRKDSVTITQDSSSEDLWEARIVDSQGNTVTDTFWKGEVGDYTWDGKNNEGTTVQDGNYTYILSSTDNAGNTLTKRIENIQIDTKATPIYVSTDNSAFSPNGNGRKDSVNFNLYAEVTDGIEHWELAVQTADSGTVVQSFEGSSPLPETVQWKGMNSDQETAEEAEYIGRFTVQYANGNEPQETTEKVIVLDISDPAVEISVSPKPFSPDGDGVDDTVTIDVEATDNNRITSWTGEILDPAGNVFYKMTGEGSVDRSFTWDGKSESGELVQAASDYTLELVAQDRAGNFIEKTRIIPVDIFLVEEDGQTKIKISSIIFPPDSPDHTAVDREQRQKNKEIIDMIAKSLKKYSQYQVLIQGHAVVEYWKWEGAAEWEQYNELIPLSENRAESVKNALVARGVKESRLSVRGAGGNDPVVPNSDIENRWKNRRVEFILTEQ